LTSPALPLLGLGLGAASSTIGASGLAVLLWGAPQLSQRDRWTIGLTMATLIGGGAMLTAISSTRYAEMRR
jgi:hypothetical protein